MVPIGERMVCLMIKHEFCTNSLYASAVYLVQHLKTNKRFAMKKILKHHMRLKKQVSHPHHREMPLENPFIAGEWSTFETEVSDQSDHCQFEMHAWGKRLLA